MDSEPPKRGPRNSFEERRERARRRMEETPEETKARHKQEREESLERRNDEVRGRDLVAEVLAHPNPSEMDDIHVIRDVLFNRSVCQINEKRTIERITNGAYRPSLHGQLFVAAALPDGVYKVPFAVDAWKFVYCDRPYLDEGASIQEKYEAQLREEELQTPEVRAKERIRTAEERAARRNAAWVIPLMLELSARKIQLMEKKREGSAFLSVWKQVAPPAPAWVQHIVNARESWGFVFYKEATVQAHYGRRWDRTWEKIRDRTCQICIKDHRSSLDAALLSIHTRGDMPTLQKLWMEDWAHVSQPNILSNDNTLRGHFREYRETLPSPGILRNTFLVVPLAPILEVEQVRSGGYNYSLFWLWAYDADWEPSADDVMPNGEKYQGRMKVLISCLDAWFYAARWEGVSMRDMWRKAQESPEQVWICYTDPYEAWKHEPYGYGEQKP